MRRAIEHVNEMRKTHHVDSFEKMIVLSAAMFERGDLRAPTEGRRINIKWLPGRPLEFDRVPLLTALDEYKGYRVLTIDTNDLESSIRLVRGELRAHEEFEIMLETKSLTSFETNGELIQMEFGPKTLGPSEIPFLKTIKDYVVDYGHNYATMTIKGFHKPMIGSGKVSYKDLDPSSSAQSLNAVIKTLDCKDCKDGYYYPFNGPREPCQTCKEAPADLLLPKVANLFAKQVDVHMPGLTKDTSMTDWKTYRVTLDNIKDCSPELLALNAGSEMARTLKGAFTEAVAFEPVSKLLPGHVKSIWSNVSAVLSLRDSEMIFQVRVTT